MIYTKHSNMFSTFPKLLETKRLLKPSMKGWVVKKEEGNQSSICKYIDWNLCWKDDRDLVQYNLKKMLV